MYVRLILKGINFIVHYGNIHSRIFFFTQQASLSTRYLTFKYVKLLCLLIVNIFSFRYRSFVCFSWLDFMIICYRLIWQLALSKENTGELQDHMNREDIFQVLVNCFCYDIQQITAWESSQWSLSDSTSLPALFHNFLPTLLYFVLFLFFPRH